jgi:hypothetical protein
MFLHVQYSQKCLSLNLPQSSVVGALALHQRPEALPSSANCLSRPTPQMVGTIDEPTSAETEGANMYTRSSLDTTGGIGDRRPIARVFFSFSQQRGQMRLVRRHSASSTATSNCIMTLADISLAFSARASKIFLSLFSPLSCFHSHRRILLDHVQDELFTRSLLRTRAKVPARHWY